MLKNNGYTEKEKEELFKKLKKISKLFGLNLKIEEDTRENNSAAIIGENKIRIGLTWKEHTHTSIDKLHSLMCNNVGQYNNALNRSEFEKIPVILYIFTHEIAHLLTMDMDDVKVYMSYTEYLNGNTEDYRQHPYEKLADNLAYQLICDNYNSIINILLDKRIRIDNRRICRNVNTAKQFKNRFVNTQ